MAYAEVIDKMENRLMICMKQCSETNDYYYGTHTQNGRRNSEQNLTKIWGKKM